MVYSLVSALHREQGTNPDTAGGFHDCNLPLEGDRSTFVAALKSNIFI